jgi:hypothetical protein
MAQFIQYSPELEPIANLDQLGRGYGSPYLECIRSHTGELVAKQWRMMLTERIAKQAEIIIRMRPHSDANLGR